MAQDFSELLTKLNRLLDRVERLVPDTAADETDWDYQAWRWLRDGHGSRLVPVKRPHRVNLDDLLCIDRQKEEAVRNTLQFVQGHQANNILLWGSRGTGKSTLIKSLFNAYVNQGLRLIEVHKEEMNNLPLLTDLLQERPERFILFCDDLSFEASEPDYKALKAALEGSIAAPPENVLIYATSNRRHLLPEFHAENQQAKVIDGELHLGDALEEKISLSERFGLCLSFHPFSQDQYLQVVDHWLTKSGLPNTANENTRRAALQWAGKRGGRSGRTARQFVIDWLGRQPNE